MKTGSMGHWRTSGLLLAALVLTLGPKAYGCNQIKRLDNRSNLTNDPNPTLEFEVRRTQDTTLCEYVIGITRGSANDGSYNRFLQRMSSRIPLQFWNNSLSQSIFNLPDATPPNNVLNGSFVTTGGAKEQFLSFRAQLGLVPFSLAPGSYTNSWQVQLWTRPVGSNAAFTLVNSDTFSLTYTVVSHLALSLVATGGSFDAISTSQNVDFGTLELGETRSFDMIIGNNLAYTYSLSSQNGGYLRRGSAVGVANQVAYELKILATAITSQVTLNPGSYPYTSPVLNPSAGSETRFPMQVKILDNPASKNQGLYTDTITVTITAN